jgi:hypothetical protein
MPQAIASRRTSQAQPRLPGSSASRTCMLSVTRVCKRMPGSQLNPARGAGLGPQIRIASAEPQRSAALLSLTTPPKSRRLALNGTNRRSFFQSANPRSRACTSMKGARRSVLRVLSGCPADLPTRSVKPARFLQDPTSIQTFSCGESDRASVRRGIRSGGPDF